VSGPLNRPGLVATDLDGTLLRSDGTVSSRSRDALAALEQAGIPVVFVTARPPRWLEELALVVASHGLAICANGAVVYDVARRRIVSVTTLPAATVAAVAESLRSALPGTAFATESEAGFAKEPGFLERHPLRSAAPTGDIETLLDPLPAKLLARNEAYAPEDFVARAGELVGDLVEIHVSGATGLLEMSAPGVTKASALATWCQAHGIEREDVWAFGDMPNDLPMLSWAGTSFAVANAHSDVLAVASRTCPSNDDDGVAQMLELAPDPAPNPKDPTFR
jgi:Cof subfamily protein (haloacid dehalogenase superfamily)